MCGLLFLLGNFKDLKDWDERETKGIFSQERHQLNWGLVYFSENERLYEKYLFRFLEEPTFPELFKAIEEDRREDARRAAHSLKGITATLGFTSLNTPVKAQEFEFKNGRWEEGNQYTDELKKEYARIISVLRAVKALEN